MGLLYWLGPFVVHGLVIFNGSRAAVMISKRIIIVMDITDNIKSILVCGIVRMS